MCSAIKPTKKLQIILLSDIKKGKKINSFRGGEERKNPDTCWQEYHHSLGLDE